MHSKYISATTSQPSMSIHAHLINRIQKILNPLYKGNNKEHLEHGTSVAKIAIGLYAQLAPKLNIPFSARGVMLLHIAALYHDIGWTAIEKYPDLSHAAISSEIILKHRKQLNTALTNKDITYLAFLTEQHGRTEARDSNLYREIRDNHRELLIGLAYILRISDVFDREHTGVIGYVDVCTTTNADGQEELLFIPRHTKDQGFVALEDVFHDVKDIQKAYTKKTEHLIKEKNILCHIATREEFHALSKQLCMPDNKMSYHQLISLEPQKTVNSRRKQMREDTTIITKPRALGTYVFDHVIDQQYILELCTLKPSITRELIQ